MDKNKIFTRIKKMKKSELISLLEIAFAESDKKQRKKIFGEIQEEIQSRGQTPKTLEKEVNKFYEDSINRKYYSPFNINSKNWTHIPFETEDWFSKIGKYLDRSSQLVKDKEYELANRCFEKLYKLIKKMEDGEEIVFADEYGTWMIQSSEDYDKAYIESLSKLENPEIFAEKVIPILKRDSFESFSSKIYSKVKKYGKVAQLKEVEKEIKLQNIRIKSRFK